MADEPIAQAEPAPVPPEASLVPRTQVAAGIVAVVITVTIGVAAAFGLDVCGALASIGVRVTACPVATP